MIMILNNLFLQSNKMVKLSYFVLTGRASPI